MRKLVVFIALVVGCFHGGCLCVSADDLRGLHFDGRSYVVITNVSDLRMDDAYTVEMWVKPSAGNGNYGLFNRGNGWNGGAKCLTLGGFKPSFALCNVIHSGGVAGKNQVLASGQWSHVAWVVQTLGGDQREYRTYVNGELNGVFTNKTLPDEGFVELGRYANCCDGFVGDMVDVRYWNVPRTEQNIQEYMLVPPRQDTNLMAHWLYDSGEGITVTDSSGNHNGLLEGAGSGSNAWRLINAAPGVVSPTLQGLWVGQASVGGVSRAAVSSAQTNNWDNTPVETAQAFPLRLLIHIDSSGGMRLLPEVYLAGALEWELVTNYTGNVLSNVSSGVVVSNQVWRYGVYSSSESVPLTRREHVQRLSAVGFPCSAGPVVLVGETNCFGGRVELPYDDGLNPFVHIYHPDHDNKDVRGNKLGDGVESFSIDRNISLQFFDTNPDQSADPHWKVDRWGGVYREEVDGVYRYPLFVEGVFSLQKVSDAGTID